MRTYITIIWLCLVPPGIPTSLTVVGNVVRWLPSNVAGNNTGTAAFYFVQFAPFDFPSSTNMIETLEVTVDLTGHVMPGSRYRVRVRAGNTGGLSNWSDPVMFAAVNQPPNPAGNLVTLYDAYAMYVHTCAAIVN